MSKYLFASEIPDDHPGRIEVYSFEHNETYIGEIISIFRDERNGTSRFTMSNVSVLNSHDEPIDFLPLHTVEILYDEKVKLV